MERQLYGSTLWYSRDVIGSDVGFNPYRPFAYVWPSTETISDIFCSLRSWNCPSQLLEFSNMFLELGVLWILACASSPLLAAHSALFWITTLVMFLNKPSDAI